MKLLTAVCLSVCVAVVITSPVKRVNSNGSIRRSGPKPQQYEEYAVAEETAPSESDYVQRPAPRYPVEEQSQPEVQQSARKRVKNVNKPQTYDPVPASSNQYDSYGHGSQDSDSQQFEQSVQAAAAASNPGEDNYGRGNEKNGRLQFAIHGQQGPESYKFGYDTGKGDNRQFRYEAKDDEGIVHGRYGFYDKNGKLHVVNYTAHPKYGFSTH